MNYAERKLRNARAHVVQAHPFFGTLLLRQKLVETTRCETLATDGDHLYFNPAYVEKATISELHFDCAHEALHPGLCHHTRRGDRDFKRWNHACDYAINQVLVDSGFEMPKDALLDAKYKGMTSEQIYAALAQPQQQDQGRTNGSGGQQSGGSADGQPQPGDGQEPAQGGQDGQPKWPSFGGAGCVLDAPAANAGERSAKEAEWKVALAQAAMAARAAGSMPGSLDVAITGVLEPRADWRDLLRRYMDQFAKADYSWRQPNRRFVANGTYLPSLHSEALSPVLLVIDASGSMPDSALRAAASEISDICSMLRPEWVDVIVHDTRVTARARFEPGDEISIDTSARGGTLFAPVCDFVNQADEHYACVIWFTDLEPGDWAQAAAKEPGCPVLWIDYADSKVQPPFGEDVVRMPKEAA